MDDLISRQEAIDAVEKESQIDGAYGYMDTKSIVDLLSDLPTADVRKNIKAQKVIGGGEHDGATLWFECSQCHGTVDIDDAYCKHCGAQMER